MTEATELAWAAGFIDGEGCISVVRCTQAGVTREQVQLLLDVAQVRPEALHKLVRLFGGRIRLGGPGKGIYYWRLYGRKAGTVLSLVLPYLVTKRRQGELALELVSMLGTPGRRRSDTVYARTLAIAEEFRVLNYRRPRHAERLSEPAPLALVANG